MRWVDVEIASISFAFDNKELMEMLIKRGKFLSTANYIELLNLDTKIDDHFKNKECQEKIKRPVSCFITFTTQEAKARCIENFKAMETWKTWYTRI